MSASLRPHRRRTLFAPFFPRGGFARLLVLGGAILTTSIQVPLVATPAPENTATLAPASPSAPAVDATIVLRAGPVEVSRYALEKQHRQFLAQAAQEGRPPPDPAAIARWLEVFHARQIVTAHALALGYDTHPAVLRIVDTMESHMLSQTDGPYYHSLYAARPPLEAKEFDLLFAASRRELDLVALVIPAGARDALLGPDWESTPDAGRLARLDAARHAPDAQYLDGWSAWPHLPVDHAAAALTTTPVGTWIETRLDAFPEPRIAVIHVRAERMFPPPGDENGARASFARRIEQHRKREIQQAHRARTLRAADFVFEAAAASELLAALSALPPATIEIAPASLGPRPDAPLCRYVDATGEHTVSGLAWAEAFNRLFLRRLPTDLPALRRSAEDLVLARLDEAAARRLALDRTPQFTEDRRNFHYAQVLDLFERERLQPEIVISAETVAAYHAAHAADFAPVAATRVRRLRFSSEAAASAWRPDIPDAPQPTEETLCEISTLRPLPDAAHLTYPMLYTPEGGQIGPLRVGSDHILYVKASPTRQTAPELADVEPEIRRRLTREALDTRLLALARKVAPDLRIEDHIPYTHFGLSGPPSPRNGAAGRPAEL